jgi:hypothetical protein
MSNFTHDVHLAFKGVWSVAPEEKDHESRRVNVLRVSPVTRSQSRALTATAQGTDLQDSRGVCSRTIAGSTHYVLAVHFAQLLTQEKDCCCVGACYKTPARNPPISVSMEGKSMTHSSLLWKLAAQSLRGRLVRELMRNRASKGC